MKSIHIGLTSNDLSSLLHESVYLFGEKSIAVTGYLLNKEQILNNSFEKPLFEQFFFDQCLVECKNGSLRAASPMKNAQGFAIPESGPLSHTQKLLAVLLIKSTSGQIGVNTSRNIKSAKRYHGQLIIIAERNKVRLILNCSLEEYVQSVLQGEVPANYHIEAIKAQAVCARSYALHPRVNHSKDYCNVCDSYQCCQCFTGLTEKKISSYMIACGETTGQILTYNDRPALALFSSSGGGHTENYEDCFSDYTTRVFPPAPIPYLKGVSENLKENPLVNEKYLRSLWQMPNPSTVDAWSKHFRWSMKLTNEDLEAHLHNNVALLTAQDQFLPFITPPTSGIFGEIFGFDITKRGCGGTAIDLIVRTSKGNWRFVKELTIRSLFKNSALNLKRLASARIFFDQIKDNKERLRSLQVFGFGSGHGVGLQQVGAEGLARQNKAYQEILHHYYRHIDIAKL